MAGVACWTVRCRAAGPAADLAGARRGLGVRPAAGCRARRVRQASEAWPEVRRASGPMASGASSRDQRRARTGSVRERPDSTASSVRASAGWASGASLWALVLRAPAARGPRETASMTAGVLRCPFAAWAGLPHPAPRSAGPRDDRGRGAAAWGRGPPGAAVREAALRRKGQVGPDRSRTHCARAQSPRDNLCKWRYVDICRLVP